MFFIHGGGFVGGNGIVKDELGPDYLVENDVVVVTINYRLNIFGFLSLDIPEASGNMGLKDQVQALKWVQKNIQQFGGDSNNVTIFGISAGSASVEYLLLSPLSEGLFHKAILQSGSTINHWASNYEPRKLLDSFLKEMRYKGSENEKDIHEFLLKAPAEELVDVSRKVTAEFKKDRLFPGFTPTIEKDLGTGDAFLTELPYKLLKAGKFHRVPVIKGFCNKEGYLTCFIQPEAMLDVIKNKQFHKHFAFDIEEEDRKKLCAELQHAYVASEANPNKIGEDFFGDLDFIAGIWISGRIMADLGNPVYFYELSYDGNINLLKRLFGIMKEGAAHGDDGGYIFKHIDVSKFAEEKDIAVRANVTKMWTNFAKTGVPTTKDSVIEWPAYTASTPVYLNIDENLSIKSNYEPKKIAAFQVIYDKYGK
ncbi:juvenile hormone esterase-like isoform X2 [Aricia agestis]|nr:juvenile hormone esterase-like isoform X2 [Aricia agestis]